MNKRFFGIIGIVSVGFLLSIMVVKTAPKPVKKPIEVRVPLVEVTKFNIAENRPSWQGGAAVNANKSVNLVAQVAGQMLTVNTQAAPGNFVKKGTVLANIDDTNYQLILQQARARVVQAQSSLDIEQAQVENAKKDYQRSGIKLNPAGKSLALRQPQLASEKAALSIAISELKKAQLDVNRTRILMPFDGHVLSQNLTEGAYVNNTSTVFEVLNARQYWLEVKVPQTFIEVLDINYPVQLQKLGDSRSRNAKILTILPQVDALDRQARILISVDNPLALKDKSLQLITPINLTADQNPISIRYNDYVQVTLSGLFFSNVSKVETDALNNSDKMWVVDVNMQLQYRSLVVLYSGRKFSWVKIDSQPGDQVLVSSIDSPYVGQTVRLMLNTKTKDSPNSIDDEVAVQ
ncbi:MAG: RND family efflux transporter MFP subunit [Bermanella sp.]|jgi:multidrug efflux system membrane fusion protein